MTTGKAADYTVRVAGYLDDHWAQSLDDWALAHESDNTTALRGTVADQAQLHGILTRLRDIGADLVSLTSEPAGDAPIQPSLPHTLTTKRLTLRAATAGDAEATWSYRRQPDVGRWLTEIPTDPAAYATTFGDPSRLANTVIVEHQGEVIGDFMLRLDDAWAQFEASASDCGKQAALGWVLDPRHTGQGFATEAVRALIDECFTNLGIRRVTANCFLGNDASWRLMERLGMRREEHAVKESLHRSGEWLDTLTYAILATEWRTADAT